MDSRKKIGAALPEGATVVKGYFDPLLAEHARMLATCPRPLAVWIVDPPAPLLPIEARRLLLAALESVDCVLTGESPVHLDWTSAQETARQAFIAFVQQRAGG